MSNLTNDRLQFQLQAPLVLYRAEFDDEFGNRWRIDCAGLPELVEQFAKQRGVFVSAEPITLEEAQARARVLLAEAAPLAEHAPASALASAAAQPRSESIQRQTAPAQKYSEQPAVVELDEPSLEAPGLAVDLVLLNTAQPGPHRVKFEIDPSVTQQNPVYSNSFRLARGDVSANVTCTPLLGQVGMWLESPTRVNAVAGTARASGREGSVWTAKVQWVLGAPATFNLSGDLVAY